MNFFTLLAVLFIGLKLTGLIAWSWVWVLAPIWGAWILGAIVFVVVVVIEAISEA